jgi:hypothetical protein
MKKMKKIIYLLFVFMTLIVMSCSENYSNGERIGFLTKFSKKGLIWKSWEGELNLTQTGMNTSSLFDFSIDNDNQDQNVISTLDSAAVRGWKVKVKYHETTGWNWFKNRGETDYFVTNVEILDKNMVNNIKDITNPKFSNSGKVVDTIYVVVINQKIFINILNSLRIK